MNCIVCGRSQWTYLFQSKDRMFELPGKFSLYTCWSCGLWRVYPQPSGQKLSFYYPSRKYYSYTQTTKPGPFWRLRSYVMARKTPVSRLLNVLVHIPAIPRFKKRGRIMDIGCGTGDTLVQLSELGWRTYGMEIDKEAVSIARKRGLAHVRLGSYTSLTQYPDNYFDVIRLYHVIEHLDDPNTFLTLAYKKLKKEGELIIGTPNTNSLIAKLARTYWYNLDSPRHLYVFSPKTLRWILTKHGFSIKYTDYCSIGGIVGSIQYFSNEKFGVRKKFIHNAWAIILFFPLERVLDWFRQGDVFIMHGSK